MHSNVRHGKTAENKKLKKVLTYPKSSSILKIGKQKPREHYQGGRIMFTKNAEQRNVMCMMDKEMRMYMCMSNCALMYRKLPVASADQSNAV